jgi:hypothetical protein
MSDLDVINAALDTYPDSDFSDPPAVDPHGDTIDVVAKHVRRVVNRLDDGVRDMRRLKRATKNRRVSGDLIFPTCPEDSSLSSGQVRLIVVRWFAEKAERGL